MHVGYVFLSHPFGLGLNVLEDYYGSKGYVLFLQALLAYLCLSSLKTTSNELGKVLQWAVFLTIIFTLISTAQGILSPNSAGANPAAAAVSASAASEDTRQSTFLQISLLAVQLLIINYSVWPVSYTHLDVYKRQDLFTAAWLMRQWTQEEGALLLSALTGTDIMTAPRLLPPALAADFMPLGDLYETELADLFPGFLSPAPDAAMRDSLLIRLHRAHESATPLAGLFPESELEIRRWQRRARASEWMRRKLPPRLTLRSIPGRCV